MFESLVRGVDLCAMIMLMDKNRVITFLSDQFVQTTGYSREELIGRNHRVFKSENLSEEEYEAVWSQVQTGKSWQGEVQNFRKDGSPFWCITTLTPILGADGKITGYVAVRFDITSRKLAEMKLLQASKMASLGEMAAGIAHEINNPLAIIQGKVYLLEKMCEKSEGQLIPSDRCHAHLKAISQTVDRIAKVVRGLRTFSRSADLDPMEEFELKAMLDETIELCSARFRGRGVEIRLSDFPEIRVRGRPSQISQVFLNLLNNAYDAIQNRSEKWVEIAVSDRGIESGRIKITVTDSGLGIPMEISEKLMQPFFTTKDVGKGTGLGLSISKGIIEDHGGQLYLNSRASHTQFIVELPRVVEGD